MKFKSYELFHSKRLKKLTIKLDLMKEFKLFCYRAYVKNTKTVMELGLEESRII